MSWTANTISELFKARREVKYFIGTSRNVVMIQIWTALITLPIPKALKNQAKHAWYLSNLIALIRLNLFVKVELNIWLDNSFAKE